MFQETPSTSNENEFDTEEKEMVYPWLKLAAKLVHERDFVLCEKPGRYCARSFHIHERVFLDIIWSFATNTRGSRRGRWISIFCYWTTTEMGSSSTWTVHYPPLQGICDSFLNENEA